VAALTVDAARAAREEARRLCVDSSALRLSVRQNLRLAAARKERAETVTVEAADAQRAVPATSPWSELLWLRADTELGRVLIPVD
jgi:hypothetical protein